VAWDKPQVNVGGCWRRPILGGKFIFGTCLFLERKIYFWSAHHRLRKFNMQKEENKCGMHVDRPIHARVRVFNVNVMDIIQKNSVNKGLGGLGEVGYWLIRQGDIVLS
jgi:hypothetical protein